MGSSFQELWADALFLADSQSANHLLRGHVQGCLAIAAAIALFSIAGLLLA
jgi:hypothetical protein